MHFMGTAHIFCFELIKTCIVEALIDIIVAPCGHDYTDQKEEKNLCM